MDKKLDLSSLNLAEKQLLSEAFETFNRSIEKLRAYQAKLQVQVQTLNEELRDKNQELTNVLQSLKSGLVVTDLKGQVLTFNRAAVAITGIAHQDALGQEINGLLGMPLLEHPLDQGDLDEAPRELLFTRADGTEILLEATTTAMLGEDQKAQGVIVNLNDVTLLKRLQQEAQRKNRLAAMGEIAMQVAHEVRNPLGSIELFVSMMKKDFAEDSGEMELLKHITSAIHSMNHIISNLLEYSRPKPIQLEALDLGPLVAEFLSFSEHTAEQQAVQIAFEEPEEGLWIKGTPQLIKQALLNIFMNACQAMEEGGELKVSLVGYEETDPVVLERFQKQVLGDRESLPVVRLAFKDSGRGMDEETRQRLFDPFFTTREQGTGLGMSIVHKTMSSHGGTIEVTSKPGEGTCIALLFPMLGQEHTNQD